MTQNEHHDFDGITENREQRPPVYFTVLFYGLIVWGVAFCAFYLLSGWSSDSEFQAKMQAHQAGNQAASAPPASTAPPDHFSLSLATITPRPHIAPQGRRPSPTGRRWWQWLPVRRSSGNT